MDFLDPRVMFRDNIGQGTWVDGFSHRVVGEIARKKIYIMYSVGRQRKVYALNAAVKARGKGVQDR